MEQSDGRSKMKTRIKQTRNVGNACPVVERRSIVAAGCSCSRPTASLSFAPVSRFPSRSSFLVPPHHSPIANHTHSTRNTCQDRPAHLSRCVVAPHRNTPSRVATCDRHVCADVTVHAPLHSTPLLLASTTLRYNTPQHATTRHATTPPLDILCQYSTYVAFVVYGCECPPLAAKSVTFVYVRVISRRVTTFRTHVIAIVNRSKLLSMSPYVCVCVCRINKL